MQAELIYMRFNHLGDYAAPQTMNCIRHESQCRLDDKGVTRPPHRLLEYRILG